MKKILLTVLLMTQFLSGNDQYHTRHFLFCLNREAPFLKTEFREGRIFTDRPALNRILTETGVVHLEQWLPNATEKDVVDGVQLNKIYKAVFNTNKSITELEAILGKFRQISDIHSAEPEAINRLLSVAEPYVPSDPYFNRQWYLQKIMADKAWALWREAIPGDSTVLVGVVDTGIDTKHPDLIGALFLNPGEDVDGDGRLTAVDSNRVDDDGNGKVDDFHGWDFAGVSGIGFDNDVRPPNAGPGRELSHGTHVAGIIGATTDNQTGIAGISFRSKIIATKHAADEDLTEPGIVNGYSGVLYCAQMGAKIINCSWGGAYDYFGKKTIDNVTKNYGAIVVCAAGNDNTNNDVTKHYPSDLENTIAVASTNLSDRKAYYSNYGNIIDISAPGGEGSSYTNAIYSAIHANAGSYEAFQGTSMASPVVAGCFALLAAWFPDSSRAWYINTLLNSADPIDDLNSAHSGLLGSGRVNIYNAIARSILPELSVDEFVYDIADLNGDGALNPGENVQISLLIGNAPEWATAENITISASSTSAFATFTDPVSVVPMIRSGELILTSDDPIQLTISENATYEPVPVHFTIRADQANGYPYETSADYPIPLSLNQTGFPNLTIGVAAPIAVENILGDEHPEIIAVGENDSLYVYHFDGSVADGFPVALGGYTTSAPAIADLTGNGQLQIISATRGGIIKIFNTNGSVVLDTTVQEQIFGNISVANLDADPELEIAFGTMGKKLHVLNANGSESEGFPKACAMPIDKGIVLADLDADGNTEMIFGQFNGQFLAINTIGDTLNHFPLTLSARASVTPVILNRGAELVMVVPTTDSRVQMVSLSGGGNYSYPIESLVHSSPGLNDTDDDGQVEVFFGTNNGYLHGISLTGDTLAGFPVQLDGTVKTSPVFADFDNDGLAEIVVTTETGRLYIVHNDGSLYAGFPASAGIALDGSSAITDLDFDGDLDVITGGADGLYVFDIKGEKGSGNYWRTYLGNNRRTGYWADAVTGVCPERKTPVADGFKLFQNYPNPFNPETKISFRVPADAVNSEVKLDVFNLLGQRIASLFRGRVQAKDYEVVWNGTNGAGDVLPSGIYIYRLKAGKLVLTKRMLLLK